MVTVGAVAQFEPLARIKMSPLETMLRVAAQFGSRGRSKGGFFGASFGATVTRYSVCRVMGRIKWTFTAVKRTRAGMGTI